MLAVHGADMVARRCEKGLGRPSGFAVCQEIREGQCVLQGLQVPAINVVCQLVASFADEQPPGIRAGKDVMSVKAGSERTSDLPAKIDETRHVRRDELRIEVVDQV